MSTPTTAELRKYSDLQMAAEAFLMLNGQPKSGTQLIAALKDGNDWASRFTPAQAAEFEKYWVVETQIEKESGFSGTVFRCIANDPVSGAKVGEVVMSFRSTEFVDDHARDNLATNTLEIAKTGFAWGQLRDMEDWYAKLVDQGTLVPGQFAVTGYSLGGHLASAFNEMHPGAAKQVVTFNGAGIGGHTAEKTLSQLVGEFKDLASTNGDGSSKFSFTNPELSALYDRARTAIKAGGQMSAADRSALQLLIQDLTVNGVDTQSLAQATMLRTAVERIQSIRDTLEYLRTITDPRTPKEVLPAQMSAHNLDYQMAVLTVGQQTDATGLLSNLERAYRGKQYLSKQPNQFDVVGDTYPSAVANSQYHIGMDVKVFIEDQPLVRGGAEGTILQKLLGGGGLQLLVDKFNLKDFGDTHSLVLLVDSLAVQNTVLNMLPEAQRGAAASTLQQAFKDASNRRVLSGTVLNGGGQGKSEGDALENIVNSLAVLTLGPTAAKAKQLKASNEGNTWANVGDGSNGEGRQAMYALLDEIQKSSLYKKAAAGQISLNLISTYHSDLDELARTDFGVYVALYTLSPFALRLGEGEVPRDQLTPDWLKIYDDWNEDRKRVNPTDGSAAQPAKVVSDQWLKDRADFLVHLNSLNRENLDYIKGKPGDNPVVLAENDAGSFDGADVVWIDNDRQIKIQRGSKTGTTRTVNFGSNANGSTTEQLPGTVGTDASYGGEGADNVVGGGDRDQLQGGNGDDSLSGGDEADTLSGGNGADILGGDGGNDLLLGADGDDQLDGGDSDDYLKGGAGADVLEGGAGNDYLFDQGGMDRSTLRGGEGQDILEVNGGAGEVDLAGGDGNDLLIAALGSSTLSGGTGNDWILAGDEVDSIDGGDDADLIDAGAGADLITGGGGADLLRGGEGADTYRFALTGFGTDVIEDTEGASKLEFGGQLLTEASYDADKQAWISATTGLEIRKIDAGGSTTLAISNPGDANSTLYLRNWTAGQFGISLSGEPQARTKPPGAPTTQQVLPENNNVNFMIGDASDGGQGNDILRGSDAPSLLLGGTGNDLLDGRGGDDWLEGGTGTDLILTGAGKDVVHGGTGNDLIRAGYKFDMYRTRVDGHDTDDPKLFFSDGQPYKEWLWTDDIDTTTQFSGLLPVQWTPT